VFICTIRTNRGLIRRFLRVVTRFDEAVFAVFGVAIARSHKGWWSAL
jgi:hypothetical protein|tara:strand:- start:157 stop:297 length:141 start_codon:yes stop_codon:yes gene_type:complete